MIAETAKADKETVRKVLHDNFGKTENQQANPTVLSVITLQFCLNGNKAFSRFKGLIPFVFFL